MKALVPVVTSFLETRTSRQNLLALFKLLGVLAVLVSVYSILFHVLMAREGQDFSWITGFYWTLTVMSTLGFGDITFHSDLGRFFSIFVLGTGVVFLLVLLPFTFIEFFYAPWMKAQAEARAPRELPLSTHRHVIMTQHGPVTKILIRMLEKHGYPYFFLVPTVPEALEMHDRDLPVVVGDLSDPDTYEKVRIDQAALVVTTRSDIINTNVTFSVRETNEKIPIIATARSRAARDALELAGVSEILSLEEIMGQALARRVVDAGSCAQIIGRLGELVIAEATGYNTNLVGKSVAECNMRAQSGVTVVGVWQHGKLVPPDPTTNIDEHTFFILSGTQQQIDTYNEVFGQIRSEDDIKPSVLIIGGSRVGSATARALDEREIPWTIIEKEADRILYPERSFVGDASEFDLLVKAGMHRATTIIITTHDDDTNTFLTIFYRKLRPKAQLISRCTHEANVSRLHRAGADLVLSYADMGANMIFNELKGKENLLLAEGVSVFSSPVPAALAGMTLAESSVPSQTGCSIVAIDDGAQHHADLKPDTLLPEGGTMTLIGSIEAEEKFLATFADQMATL
ncbi:NAD-binding protein [Opitutaceae bacterium]|nr:NAD-binding protein [Opitutaceae bacterium]